MPGEPRGEVERGMDIHIIFSDDEQVVIRARAEDDGLLGDLERVVKPGESAFGFTFDELREHGPGKMEVGDDASGDALPNRSHGIAAVED